MRRAAGQIVAGWGPMAWVWAGLPAIAVVLTAAITAQGNDYGTYLIPKQNILFVYDGDTLFVSDPGCPPVFCERLGIRLSGIDTPEKRGKCQQERDRALAARQYLADAIDGAQVVELRNVGREKYGRLLGRLFVDDRDVGQEMVDRGLAVPYAGKTKIKDWCEGDKP